MNRFPRMTRLGWRLGRSLYMRARGEERWGDISRNGEAHLQQCVIANVPAEETLMVMDIGANQGEWTETFLNGLPAARRSSDHVILHAFEPVPATAAMFRDRITRLPGNSIVQVHPLAMSDSPGHAEIGVFADGAGTNSLHHAADARSPQQVIQIDLTTLDAFCVSQGIDHIHLAKCDTEGHDSKVLKGAKALLRDERIDVLQFEYNHRWVFGHAFLKDVFELVEGLPYDVVRVDETGLTLFESWHPELDRFFQSNYALVHHRALSWFAVHRGSFDGSNTFS